jgi:dienelactone hydrolase
MMRIGGAACVVTVLIAATAIAPSFADQSSADPPQEIAIPLNPLPLDLKGALRHPRGDSPFPAAILLPMCGPYFNSIERGWGATVASWGYVTLTLDVFTHRGMVDGKTCLSATPAEIADDVYRGLGLLVAQRNVDRNRIFVVGFGRGGSVALAAVERDLASRAKHRFRGAAAFYPPCGDDKGNVTVSTLVIVGALDKTTFDSCRKMVQGEDDIGISRQPGEGVPIEFDALPDAYSGFDVPAFQEPIEVRGRRFEFNKAAADTSREILQRFLQSAGR